MPDWFDRINEQTPGFERDVIERYTSDLIGLARRRLPRQIQQRCDAEDVVQSVYRSFFRRLGEGQFRFEGPDDLWRLLATMTFRKALNAHKFHVRDRRDVRRDLPLSAAEAAPEDVDLLWESLDELVRGLPERCRDILVRRLEGESVEAIARAVGRSQRTVQRVLAEVAEAAAGGRPGPGQGAGRAGADRHGVAADCRPAGGVRGLRARVPGVMARARPWVPAPEQRIAR